jgi:hypothetical protein
MQKLSVFDKLFLSYNGNVACAVKMFIHCVIIYPHYLLSTSIKDYNEGSATLMILHFLHLHKF